MNPGRLRETVTLQNPDDTTSDSFGRGSGSFADVATLRAEVREITSSGEGVVAGRDQPNQTVRVRLRARADVTSRSRFKWNGKTLRVHTVSAKDPMRRWLECMCTYADD